VECPNLALRFGGRDVSDAQIIGHDDDDIGKLGGNVSQQDMAVLPDWWGEVVSNEMITQPLPVADFAGPCRS
jgi:hypothetical protein